MSQAKPGWVECEQCNGAGRRVNNFAPMIMMCAACEGKGVVECEHAEFEYNVCLDCGYDQTDDLMDQAEREHDRQVDMAIDRQKEEKAFPMEATD